MWGLTQCPWRWPRNEHGVSPDSVCQRLKLASPSTTNRLDWPPKILKSTEFGRATPKLTSQSVRAAVQSTR